MAEPSTAQRIRSALRGPLTFLILSVSLTTLLGFLGRLYWVLDLFSHFTVQYFWIAAVLITAAAAMRERRLVLLAAALFLVNALLLAPFYLPAAQETPGEKYTLFSLNAHVANRRFDDIRMAIQESDADFIALMEVTDLMLEQLSLPEMGYPHMLRSGGEGVFGTALFSRYPVETVQMRGTDGRFPQALAAKVVLPEGNLHLVIVHPPPPFNPVMTGERNADLHAVASWAGGLTGPVLIAGDFNTSTWSPNFRAAFGSSVFEDARKGRGVQPTWPAYRPAWMRIPIDHVLVSPGVTVLEMALGPDVGSDHLPVIAVFSLER